MFIWGELIKLKAFVYRVQSARHAQTKRADCACSCSRCDARIVRVESTLSIQCKLELVHNSISVACLSSEITRAVRLCRS